MTSNDPVIEADLHAYVDDQLDVGRRIEVEAYLSENPAIAAKVMADLRVRDELRLALAGMPAVVRQETRDAARVLESAFNRPRTIDVIRRAAAVVLLVGAGWIAHGWIAPGSIGEVVASVPPPQFVEEAVRAHQTAELREKMSSQSETSRFDPAEIRSATAIVLPAMPDDWTVRDAQIFPSTYGPSVELEVEPQFGERLSLFAVRPGNFAVQQVLLKQEGQTNAAYWQIGEVAYALISETQNPDRLAEQARKLARTLY
ncbi:MULTISPECIES: anti-sigma factor [Rhizobium/Agrobacterium group]|jgi:anti-sigma factor RsiW|uniref:anti-sigma factor family protein n=1 Tax=Rhizobium/Agrobacterium group TaxID=227290 RepID=UPI0006B91940|nr:MULTISPECIES: anti-sigma factor [Rhizobium/Agrobacterium group]AOG08354.1 putative transmembrane anti-sigma factor [Agrobacterium sp. RAC06]KPF60141.1 Fis family transcriptional regulator [Rhizobium sp. AAP116]QGG92107.1 anti-sigma factor [Agrobacterium sp. MA01]